MPGSCNDVSERLYLQKDTTGNISVPCSGLSQHQIDGIRFIFSQYKKKKHGVILNYPSGCGSSVLVAIFISAICEKLKRPVLILYDSDEEKRSWLARFAKWTTITSDLIVVDTSNAYLRKQIFIQYIADKKICNFIRRSWGVVVVKSDSFINTFQKCQVNVDFKIWITAQDLKKDRGLLCFLYNWIDPSDQLLQQHLDRKTPISITEDDTRNEILLDVLLEDVVLTRRGLKPFGPHKRKPEPEVQSPSTISKKNKDATGTKIKRSNRSVDAIVPSTQTIITESVTTLQNNNSSDESSGFPYNTNGSKAINISTVEADKRDNDEVESKMDVESFIRDNDPLQPDSSLCFAMNNPDSASQPSETSSPKDEACTESNLNFTNAVADIIQLENDLPKKNSENTGSVNVEISNDSDLTPDVLLGDDLEKEASNVLNQIDLSKPVIRKVFYVSEENAALETDLRNHAASEAKTEQEFSEGEKKGIADQTSKLDVSTSMMKETDSNFDSKIKELEEKALRKFKGSFLDNIFKC